jgi:O-antigen/teichoic acid export membrane protein
MIKKIARGFNRDFKDAGFLEIVRGSATTFVVRIMGLIAGYAFTFIISRYYGSEVLGAHTLSVTVLMMFSVLGRLGLDSLLVRHFAQDHVISRWDRILEVYQKTLTVVIPVGIVLSVLLYLSSGAIALNVFKKPSLEPYFRIIAFAVLPMAMRFINSECYRGFRMNKEYAYSQNVSYFLYSAVILGVMTVFSRNEWQPNIAFAVSLMLLAISSSFLILKKIRANTKTASDELEIPGLIRNAIPMLLANSMLLISGWINTIMLGIWSTESDVGIYSVVLKIATFSSFVLMSINSVSAPRFAQLHSKGDMEGLKKYTAHTAKIIFFSSLPIFTGILIFRNFLLGLFGEEFILGSAALMITMVGQLFNVFAGSVGQFLYMTGKQGVFRNIILSGTLINIIVCALLIPLYGLLGSAIAGMVFMAAWNLMSMIYIRRTFNIRTYYWPFR